MGKRELATDEEIELVQEIEVGGLTLDGDGECDLENGEVTVAEDVQFTTDDGTYCSYDYFMDCNTLSCSCGSVSPFLELIITDGEDELGECPDDPMNPSD